METITYKWGIGTSNHTLELVYVPGTPPGGFLDRINQSVVRQAISHRAAVSSCAFRLSTETETNFPTLNALALLASRQSIQRLTPLVTGTIGYLPKLSVSLLTPPPSRFILQRAAGVAPSRFELKQKVRPSGAEEGQSC
jgi:hypothetical protein